MDADDHEELGALCDALSGTNPDAYMGALGALHRKPQTFEKAKPVILEAMSGAEGPRRFDLAFALAAVGSRDPAVLGALAETAEPLGALDSLEPFCAEPRIERARLTAASQVTGQLVVDSMGTPFLAPEEDHRGGGMGAVRLVAWSHDESSQRRGDVVKVTGFYKAGLGLLVDEILPADGQAD